MKDNEVVIIDYKLGNLYSVEQVFNLLGVKTIVTSEKKVISEAKALVLPGVGAFGDAMLNLEKYDLISPIKDKCESKTPIFGICLGMQLLFEESEEFGNSKGLGLLSGCIKKFDNSTDRVPQIGWNTIFNSHKEDWNETPFKNIPQNSYMYFVHSFYAIPSFCSDVLSYTEYGENTYCSSIMNNNLFATQFHPEKSAHLGIQIYKNWIETI